MLVGYARVSTQDQTTDLQNDALAKAGCERIFAEKASGAKSIAPKLAKALEFMREGDTLVVWKLDRLARSMRQLIETVEDFAAGKSIFIRSRKTSIRAQPPANSTFIFLAP